MTILCHPFNSEKDSEAAARFFTRLGYGSAGRAGVPLDAADLRRSLMESGLCYACVAQDGGRVVGTIMLLKRADGFVAGPGELFGDHYLVDPLHRNSLVLGRLLAAVLQYLIAAEVGTARLRIGSANEAVQRLYVQAGFRAVGSPISNGDGFVKMVSHPPGALHLLGEGERITDTHETPPGIPKHFMRHIRHSGDCRGVDTHTDGTRTITFNFDLHQRSSHLILDAHSGRLIALSVDGSPRKDLVAWAKGVGAPVAPGPVEPSTPRSIGRFSARIDERGSLVVRHPDHADPVLVDPFPDGYGLQIAPFRPLLFPLSTEETPQGWIQTCEQGEVHVIRRIALTAFGINIDYASQGGGPQGLVMQPSCLLRTTELAITDERREREGHLHCGAWSLHLSSFETTLDPQEVVSADGARHTYTDRAHDITTSLPWKGSRLLRPYGACLADDKMGVRIELDEIPAVNLHLVPPARVRSTASLAWVASGEQSYAYTGEADSRILARDGGVVQWQVAGCVVASSTGGGGRRSHVVAQPCLWLALSEFPRYGLQHGGGPAPHGGVPFLPGADPSAHPALGSWTLEASEGLSLPVPQLRAPAGEGEAVVNLRLPIDPQGITMVDSDGDLVVHHHDGTEWSAWASVARIPLGVKRYLRIEPLEATRPVILVRARLKSWVLSLYSQRGASATSLSYWNLALEGSAAEFSGAEAQDHSGDQTGGSA